MDFFFPQDDLERASPQDTRIEALEIEPYSDGRRVRVNLKMTPFQQRPYLEIVLTDAGGDEVGSASIVEPVTWNLELTLHLRGNPASPINVEARLFYPEGPQAEPVSRTFELAPQE